MKMILKRTLKEIPCEKEHWFQSPEDTILLRALMDLWSLDGVAVCLGATPRGSVLGRVKVFTTALKVQ